MCRKGPILVSQSTQVLVGGILTPQSPSVKGEKEPVTSERTRTPTCYNPAVSLTQMATLPFSQNLYFIHFWFCCLVLGL